MTKWPLFVKHLVKMSVTSDSHDASKPYDPRLQLLLFLTAKRIEPRKARSFDEPWKRFPSFYHEQKTTLP